MTGEAAAAPSCSPGSLPIPPCPTARTRTSCSWTPSWSWTLARAVTHNRHHSVFLISLDLLHIIHCTFVYLLVYFIFIILFISLLLYCTVSLCNLAQVFPSGLIKFYLILSYLILSYHISQWRSVVQCMKGDSHSSGCRWSRRSGPACPHTRGAPPPAGPPRSTSPSPGRAPERARTTCVCVCFCF